MNCVFCKIIAGELPGTCLYEDELVYAFLDIAPINPGHSLIIPKEHHTGLTTVPEDVLARMMQIAPLLAKALIRELDADGFNLHLAHGACAGQVVSHVHLHVIPRHPTDGHSWGWRSVDYTDTTPAELGDAVRARLDGGEADSSDR
jgi:histidine triad (HIT) family protein